MKQQTWEEQFDKRFSIKDDTPDYEGAELRTLVMYNRDGDYVEADDIKQFIKITLKDLVEKVVPKELDNTDDDVDLRIAVGHNNCIKQIKTRVNKYIGK